jgi:hypothetical protein
MQFSSHQILTKPAKDSWLTIQIHLIQENSSWARKSQDFSNLLTLLLLAYRKILFLFEGAVHLFLGGRDIDRYYFDFLQFGYPCFQLKYIIYLFLEFYLWQHFCF